MWWANADAVVEADSNSCSDFTYDYTEELFFETTLDIYFKHIN